MAGQDELDEAALAELYARLEKPLYNVVYRWLWNPQESQDVVQDAFLRVWDMRKRVRLATVEPLIYRIALNRASKRRRSARIWKWLSLDALREREAAGGSVHAGVESHERAGAVRSAVESLPDGLRQVIVLCELAEMSYAEVGTILRIPEGTVGSRRHKAMRLLRSRLGSRGATSTAVQEGSS